MDLANHAVVMKGIDKRFPGVHALDHVDLYLKKGEIKALIGENGAGKSTLIKILTGAYTQDEGDIIVFGNKIEKMTPVISERLGISAVYQNLVLAKHLSVAENIFMGLEPTKLRGIIDKKKLFEMTQGVLESIGYKDVVSPRTPVSRLTVAQQGMIAIARALVRGANVIIFDEPTAVLTSREVEELFNVIRSLRDRGMSIIYISHRLEEIFEICDNALVLKDGKVVGERSIKDTNIDELVTMMVGREVKKNYYIEDRKKGEEILRVEDIRSPVLKGCSLSLKAGEIVGIYGLIGAGRTELARAIFGADKIDGGKIYIKGAKTYVKSPTSAIKKGIGLIPEDRREQGLALKLSVKHNINLALYPRISKVGFVNLVKERRIAEQFIHALTIRTPTLNQIVANLSGGNQQKVVIAKWLATKAKIFLMDEPTNGVDVGAKGEIYELMNQLARGGAGVIFISSYMPELMSICDRILVMREGRIVKDVPREEFNEEKLLSLAIKSENRGNKYAENFSS